MQTKFQLIDVYLLLQAALAHHTERQTNILLVKTVLLQCVH